MAITVRVKNFQSIKDAELKISGLTVITGPNNSGKTAFLRAIRGLFTNAPSGPLVRQGEQNLSVYMMFDDGNSVFWEKGKVNQYTVNGKTLSSVGRGVPPEVEALGVREVASGSEKIWPQIARQFDGTLFLVDRPGATMAEALSDVERVGKLSDALRACESDKRSVNLEIKIRRDDVSKAQARLKDFEGFDAAHEAVQSLSLDGITLAARRLEEVRSLKRRYEEASARVKSFEGSEFLSTPDMRPAGRISAKLREAKSYRDDFQVKKKAWTALKDFDVQIPARPSSDPTILDSAKRLQSALNRAKASAQVFSSFIKPVFTASDKGEKYAKAVEKYKALRAKSLSLTAEVSALKSESSALNEDLSQKQTEVHDLMCEAGSCPTCRRPPEPL